MSFTRKEAVIKIYKDKNVEFVNLNIDKLYENFGSFTSIMLLQNGFQDKIRINDLNTEEFNVIAQILRLKHDGKYEGTTSMIIHNVEKRFGGTYIGLLDTMPSFHKKFFRALLFHRLYNDLCEFIKEKNEGYREYAEEFGDEQSFEDWESIGDTAPHENFTLDHCYRVDWDDMNFTLGEWDWENESM